MSLLQFKALTFDVVGTLIDFERGMIDFLHDADPKARVLDSEFLRAYREALASPLALYFPDDLERVWGELARQFGLPRQAAAAFRTSAPQCPAFADSVAALRRMKKHFRLVAVTNAQRWAMAQFERTLEMPFDWPVTCDDTRRGKSDPRYFVRLRDMLARQGIERAETLDVAQSQFYDIRIAQALGWRTCWIERRAGMRGWGASQPEFKPVKPDWHFTTLRELADSVEAEALEQRKRTALPLFPERLAMIPG